MVADFTIRTHGVNQAFLFVEGIWLHRKSHLTRFFYSGLEKSMGGMVFILDGCSFHVAHV